MFVANVTPVMLIASVAVYNGQAFTAIDTALLIQAAMLIAGIGTLIQLYPVWRIGSRLPVVMGLSFTFLSAPTLALEILRKIGKQQFFDRLEKRSVRLHRAFSVL